MRSFPIPSALSAGVADLNPELRNQTLSAGIGANDLLFLGLCQSLDASFYREGEAPAPDPSLEDKLQGCSAAQIPSASAATRLMFSKSTNNISGDACVQATISGSYQIEMPIGQQNILCFSDPLCVTSSI